jgi:3'(2'), 5'-bisphosphate nucleotidase
VLQQLAEIALAAGAAILPFYHDANRSCKTKIDGSPVSQADIAAEAIIIHALSALAPDIPIIAEEAVARGEIPTICQQFFLVDPLDGTREFMNGSGEFTVNIAYIDAHHAVLGVIYAPVLGVIYCGDITTGAFTASVSAGEINTWQPIKIAPANLNQLRVVASKSHLDDATQAFIKNYAVHEFTSAGSSLKFCTLAEGKADFYPRFSRTMEWDTAAGQAILTAAGGRVTTRTGDDLLYGKCAQKNDVDFANPSFIASAGFNPLEKIPA